VAALLRVLGIPDEIIVAEYLLSDGEVREQWIKHSLAGINNPVTYFSRVNLNRVRTNILQVES
jgi:protein-tyrosine phosphatase